ncbi:MAG: GEVED domain-containing protein [Flavobacterium haoranii]
MKKNYLSKTAMSANPLAMIVAKKSWKNMTTTWLLSLFTLLGFSDAFAQVANYTFSESAGTYTAITGTTAIASGWDDTVTTNTIPIGFTFNFNGTNYTTCSINSNGYITFGATLSANNLFTPISNNTGYAGAISGFGVDLIDNNARGIIYTTTGTAPNRVFTVQWREARRYAEAGNLDFQIKLFETSNRIDIVYANFGLNNNNVNVQVGLRGANNTDFNNRSLTTGNTAWDDNTTAGGANNATCRSRNNNQPSNGRTFTWTPPSPPTITSFTPSSACASSSQTVVITGTNFTGATAVTIGGTAAASYVVDSATQITATIGAGATGTIQVTTPGGTATSAATFTVNPLPANPGNPTSNSPQCNPPGVTLTRTGTPPAGVTWYWQTFAGGTSTANSAATFVATTSGTYYLRAQNNTTGCWSAGSGSLAVTITPTLSTAATTPNPTNTATGVCYAGGSPLTSLTWNAVAGATSYDVYFGAGSLPGTAIANVATNSYTLGTLSASTTYYWQVVPRNACGATTGTPATWTFTTTAAPCACVPTSANNTYPISNVTFAGINNNSSAAITAGPVYQDFTTISGNVTVGSTYNISVTSTGVSGNTFYQYVFFDWNNNGNFSDDGGPYNIGNYTTATGTFNLNITIPLTATIGTIKFRVVNSFNSILNPCATTGYFQMEDYSLNIIAPPACTTPTAVPTSLVLSAGTPSGTAINGSFTAAVPAPNSYLVVVSTSNIAPSISNGTTYTIGGNAGVGYTVVDTDTNTTFTVGGLNPSTTYYFYVYSMNNVCSGGPLYNATPLTGNLTTGATVPTYCNATTNTPGTRYIDDISFLGMLNGNIYNLNTGYTTTPAPGGYQDWTGLATKPRQAQGGGVNISFESNSRGTWKAWVDWNKDGDFTDAGELVYTSAGVAMITNTFGFIIPSGATPGDYRVRIRTYNAFGNYNPFGSACDDSAYEYYGDGANHFDSCTQFTSYSQFINAGCGGDIVTFTEYGEAEDYLFTVVEMCEANIVTVTNGEICGPGTVNVSVTGTPGTTQYRWYSAETGGALLATTATGSWTTPAIGATTSYWVTAFNGSCESLVRTEVIAKISPLPTITFTPSVPEVCGENNIVSITAGGDTELIYLIDENFEGSGLGVFSNDHITSTAYNTQTAWQKKTSTYIPNGSSWYPAISSNFGANHFAIVTSDIGTNGITIHNALVSPSVNTSTFLDLTLTFRMYYSRYYPDAGPTHNPALEYMQVEVSDNGGAWTSISGGNIVTDQGYGTDFKEFSYDMSAYINRPDIRVRIRYYAQNWYDGAAVDDIQLFGKRPLNTSFNWTSVLPVDAYQDLACTIPYTTGTPAVTVYIKPTMAQLEQTTYSFTATAVLNNGCSASSLVSINNKSKVWKGGTNGDWNNPNNWSPVGVPDATTCVIIPPAANTSNVLGTNYNGFGKTLQVVNGGNLTIHPSNTLTITDFVEVRGATSIFNIENTGSLIQVNNVANSGIISMKRNATIKALDYVYWSSPVANFASSAISPATPTSLIWKWEPTTATSYASQFGNWVNGVETMSLGRGYIVRSPNGWSSTPSVFTANFVGVPNNGNITRPITRSTYTGPNYTGPTSTQVTPDDDNWNLLGNPYPSAISADAFLTTNLTHINPYLDLWKHGNAPAAIASPFYQNYQLNYNPNDYLRYNHLGGTQFGFDGKIGAGQGFFVLMRDAGGTTENAIFNNTMRSNTHRNDQFFRTSETNEITTDFESHRIWLMMVAPNLVSSDILVGYATGAQNNFDEEFDAMNRGVKVNYELYSLADAKGLSIQGRALPFDTNDQIPLGVKIAQNGIHTIAISAADGLFGTTTQDIYLEDRTLGITHDLRTVPYSFTAAPGTYENRFVLKFNNETLGNEDFIANNVTVYTNESINISAPNQVIKSVRVHDLLGRVLGTFNNVNSKTFSSKKIAKTQSPLLVEVTLENGATKTYKVIF